MSRNRIMAGDFWNDPDLAALPRETRFFYIGLWGLADDYQLLYDDPRRCKAGIYPYDDDMTMDRIRTMVEELVARGWLKRYGVNGSSYLFCTYGKPWEDMRRRKNSDLPRPPWGYFKDSERFPQISETFGNSPQLTEKAGQSPQLAETFGQSPQVSENVGKQPTTADNDGNFPKVSADRTGQDRTDPATTAITIENGSVAVAEKEKKGSGEEKPIAETFRNFPKVSETPCEKCTRGKLQTCDRSLFHALKTGELVCPDQTADKNPPIIPSEYRVRDNYDALCKLYQAEIGVVSPTMADELRDFARTYQGASVWLPRAFQEAARNNARKWAYVRAVLEAWESQGGPETPVKGKKPEAQETKTPQFERFSQVRLITTKPAVFRAGVEVWDKVKAELKPSLNPHNFDYLDSLKFVGYKSPGGNIVLMGHQGPLLFTREHLGKKIVEIIKNLHPNEPRRTVEFVLDDDQAPCGGCG